MGGKVKRNVTPQYLLRPEIKRRNDGPKLHHISPPPSPAYHCRFSSRCSLSCCGIHPCHRAPIDIHTHRCSLMLDLDLHRSHRQRFNLLHTLQLPPDRHRPRRQQMLQRPLLRVRDSIRRSARRADVGVEYARKGGREGWEAFEVGGGDRIRG